MNNTPIQNPKYFKSAKDFRKWLEKNHDKKSELLVGFYKRNSGKASITWPEAVDAALSFGWIDGIRKSLGEDSYTIRFTPRKPGSIWSALNIKHIARLTKLGLMQPAGLKAFAKRDEKKSGIYSYENKDKKLPPNYERKFKSNKKAWKIFQSMAPWYQRTASHWIISAKQEETRLKRLNTLIKDSENGKKIGPLSIQKKTK